MVRHGIQLATRRIGQRTIMMRDGDSDMEDLEDEADHDEDDDVDDDEQQATMLRDEDDGYHYRRHRRNRETVDGTKLVLNNQCSEGTGLVIGNSTILKTLEIDDDQIWGERYDVLFRGIALNRSIELFNLF